MVKPVLVFATFSLNRNYIAFVTEVIMFSFFVLWLNIVNNISPKLYVAIKPQLYSYIWHIMSVHRDWSPIVDTCGF